jgi:hypothetical protein
MYQDITFLGAIAILVGIFVALKGMGKLLRWYFDIK